MPTIRYEIRNEYGLADPELHRAADKDDPEAVLEGVAMAGLVGVLRQLGDLAEFAAEIFHDLHEEVMCTAARGHGLMLRVQQLEAEFPSLEKAFFSQSNHSNFTYNDGTDWHANIQINQNLVTQGDMPRFILDSYEECRGPPRLFMLDKFDIAGAGACLKRYSDPSFFKMEQPSSSGMTEVNIPREKRARKMKKKGSRWKNGKTLESLLSPNTGSSLQLATSGQASEKPTTRLVRLKSRRLNRDIGRSLMGRLLELHSDMQKIVLDTSRSHLNRKLEMINSREQESVLHDIGMDKSISHPVLKDENAMASNYETPILLPTYNLEYKKMENESSELPPKAAFGVEETDNNGNLAEQNKILADSEIKSGCNVSHDEFGYPDKGDISEMTNQVLYDSEINLESSDDGYKSDDIGSEQENFMDALNTMEYEVETDSGRKRKLENFNKDVDAIEFDSVEDLEQLNTDFSEQHHVENFPVHMNSTIINGLSDSASSDTLSHMSKTQATKELFFSSNQDQNLAIDLGEPHNIIYDEICPKPEVATSVNLNTNNIHDIEIYDHSGSKSEPEEAPCDSFPTELISVPSFHPQECSDEQLSHAAVQNDISASYNKQSEGETIVNGCSHMNNQDPEVPLSTEHVSDLVSEITTENVETSTHLSATCEVSEIMSETVEMSSNLSPTCESFTENHQSECSLFTLDMPTVREMWESNDQDLEASMSDGNILSAIPLLDNGNAVAPQSSLVIAEIQHTLPLAYPFSDITSNNVRETNDASNDILNSSLGTEVEHEDENCHAEHHAEALAPEVVEIRQNLPDHLPVLKNEVNEEVSVVYNEDVSNPLTMQERESQEVANEDATIRCRLPDHLLDMEDEDKKEVVLDYDEDFSLRPTMPERGPQEVLNEDMAIRCGISDQIPYIKDEDNKEVYLEYDDLSFPSTMQERESHEVLNDEDMAIKCDISDHRPDMKHEDNGNVPVKYSEDIALPLTMQERESPEACDEDINTFSNIGLSSDLSALSTVDAENVISEENLSNDESSFNIVLMDEMPDNNAAKIPDLAHISDTKLQPTNRVNFEEKERMPCADIQRHLESNSSDMSGYPMLLDGHLESENEYTGYDSEKEIKQIEQKFLSDEVSCGIVSVEDESRGSAHLDPSSGSSPDISSSRKQSDEDCVSSPVTSHLQELKVVETYNQKDADLLDSQRIPDINSSSSEKPESGSTALDSELFAKDLSSDKDVAFASCISDSQTESLSTVKKSFSDDSMERKHGHGATSLEQNPCESIEEISSYIKFFPANPPEEVPKVEFRCEEDVTTILDEHFEQKILTNSTGFYDSIPPSGPSNDDADSDNRNLDVPSSKWDDAKQVESDAFTASTNDSENLAGSVTSDLSTVVLPQFPRLSVLSSKSTMPIPNDNESDQSSACLPLTDMEDPPPLPPLPPIGWRTGKLHEKTQSSYVNPVQHVPEACSLVPSSATEYRPALEGGRRVQPADQFADMKKLEIKSFQHGLLTSDSEHILPLRLSQLPPIVHDEMDQHDQFLLADTYMNSSHILSATPTVQYEKSLHDPNALSELKSHPADAITQFTLEDKISQQLPSLQQEKVKSLDERTSQIEQVLPTPEPERLQDSQHGNANLDKELMHHQNLFEAQSTVEDEAYHSYQGICSGDDIDIRSLEPQCTPVLEVCHPGYVVLVEQNLSNHYGVIWATEAERQGVRPSSVRNRPRNPLIDAVAAHDRSTMRKVAELVRPPIYMSDERDSLLEQIRNKAFSLKPATSTKQNMKAPPTNLKVAAIIEKANAIRQACAGSDEDDDADSWSDS